MSASGAGEQGACVAILAGGAGTRLRTRAGDLPKPMVPVMGKPLLQHQIELCREHGFLDIALLVHYRYEAIAAHFGDGSKFGVRLRYEVESTPRGTAGALRDALRRLAHRFLVLYGDTYLDVDLSAFWRAHVKRGASATLFLHPNDHPDDSDLVQLDRVGQVRALDSYPHPPGMDHRNLVNAALYVLEREGLGAFAPTEGKADIAKHMFPAMLAAGRRLHGYVSPEYIKDMGTPDRLDKVEHDIEAGLPERLSARGLRSAVFLDRDGTINREVDHLRDPAQLELLPGAAQAVRQLNRAGRLAVVVTNQPVLARGDVTEEGMQAIHARMETLLGHAGAYVDGLYVCPHHPEKGFAGEIQALKVECDCRKPRPGLIDAACYELGIGRTGSWMVGDTTADIEAGRRSGLRTVLVRTGHGGGDDKRLLAPDYVVPDLAAAVDWILAGHAATSRRLVPLALRASDDSVRLVLIGGMARVGKSMGAQVCKELLAGFGRTAHVIALDTWLKPASQRSEGGGVLSRYDVLQAVAALSGAARSKVRMTLETLVYNPASRRMHRHPKRQSIGARDVLIVEGVPALLIPELRAIADLTAYMDVVEDERLRRLNADYAWRGRPGIDVTRLAASRALDESPIVAASRLQADFIFSS